MMKMLMTKLDRWHMTSAVIIACSLGVLAVNIYVLVTLVTQRPAPNFTELASVQTKAPVCAGDPIEWKLKTQMLRVPAVVQVFTSVHRADTKEPLAVVVPAPISIVFLEPIIDYTRTMTMTSPTNLPAGDYLLRRAAVEVGPQSKQTGYEIRFSIKDCKKEN